MDPPIMHVHPRTTMNFYPAKTTNKEGLSIKILSEVKGFRVCN